MSRVTNGLRRQRKHKKILKMAKGYRGRAKNCFSIAIRRVEKGLVYAYRDRRNRKRDMRSLWIQRLNAAARQYGMSYSVLIHKLDQHHIMINRKILSNMAIQQPEAFKGIMDQISA